MLDKKTTVIIIANYAADYAGNFIESLDALESKLKQKNYHVEYVFPENAPFEKWYKHYKSKHIVYTAKFASDSLTQCLHSIVNNHIIIHSHFISPSRSEAFGYSVVEAAYCETQVIASDIPGQNSLKDIPGILWIEKENSVALSNAIDKCFYRRKKQLDYLKKQKKVQKEYIRKNYNLNTWCDEIIEVYEA